ncbi:MAG: helix-turn-helix domain-containing protein [Robiginitomaculum sp.]|nr:helix-turn-helix domain-containing protein [Robiginitomaculum sp.]
MEHYYTTKEILKDSRADMWRAFISETFVELDCNGMSGKNFFGEVRARNVDDLGFTLITTDAYDVFRTQARIADSARDDFLVSIQTKGSSITRQLGREAVLGPGDFTIYDSAVPYHLHFANRLSQIVIQIPRKQLKKHFSVPESLAALTVKGGSGIAQIMTNFAKSAFNQSPALDTRAQKQVAQIFLELLATSIRDAAGVQPRQPMNRATQLVRIKHFIANRLKDPSLSPKLIATAHSITVRYLQILFEDEGVSPAKYIWEQRLNKARLDLINPRMQHKSVSQICFTWAFNDTAHFSRSFKSEFGMPPRMFRQSVGLNQ